jgi:hypothetical protein
MAPKLTGKKQLRFLCSCRVSDELLTIIPILTELSVLHCISRTSDQIQFVQRGALHRMATSSSRAAVRSMASLTHATAPLGRTTSRSCFPAAAARLSPTLSFNCRFSTSSRLQLQSLSQYPRLQSVASRRTFATTVRMVCTRRSGAGIGNSIVIVLEAAE